MQVKKFVVAAMVAGGLGASLSLGAGQAAADPHWWVPAPPPPPGHVGHVVNVPPGHVGQWVGVPPGHLGQWVGVPPGHWDKPWKWVG